jgi:RHS repeat-associated protein
VENYYPYGGDLGDSTINYAVTPPDYYRYEGHELQPELNLDTYDFGARHYDPVLGRFMGVDALAEESDDLSPYTYVANNPMNFTDPDGMQYTTQNIGSGIGQWGTGQLEQINVSGGTAGGGAAASAGGMPDWLSQSLGIGGAAVSGALQFKDANSAFSWKAPKNTNWSGLPKNTNKVNTEANQGVGPFQVGWEWMTGTGPRHRDFTNGDYFTELLKQHSHIEELRDIIRHNIAHGRPLAGSDPYQLGGIKGVGLYIKDYSTLLTGGLTGNLAVTYLGSYDLTWQVTGISGNNANVTYTVTNSSTIESATHPPVIGYTSWWNKHIGKLLNKVFSKGPLSKTTQKFKWKETIKWKN